MDKNIKRLGKETLIYGTSTVLARLLNFFLTPFYTYFLNTTDNGVISTLFAMLAIMNIFYLFGFDQAYLRFASDAEDKKEVFKHSFYAVISWGAILSALMFIFANGVSYVLGIGVDNAHYVRLGTGVLFLDALNMIAFTKLRLEHRAWYYASVRIVSIVVNVALNILFLAVLKKGVASVMWANIFASLASLLLLAPAIFEEIKPNPVITINKDLRRRMFGFAWPFVPSGAAAMLVNVIDKPLLNHLASLSAVGIYQTNVKMGIFMMLIVSMFDQAWRPFFLQRAKEEGHKQTFSRIFSVFFGVALLCAMGISFLMPDVIRFNIFGKHLIHPNFWSGMNVIPYVSLGYFFYGLYINFMVAPVLTKKTKVLMLSTVLGAVVSIIINLWLVPRIGIVGAGVSLMGSYMVMALTLFIFLQMNYPIKYDYKSIFFISLAALCAGFVNYFYEPHFAVKCALLAAFACISYIILKSKIVKM